MHIQSIKYIYVLCLFVLVGVFGFTNFSLAQTGQCQVESGSFRNFSNGQNFQNNWLSNSYNQNDVRPYIYLDVIFNENCLNQLVELSVEEEDNNDFDDAVDDFDNHPFIVAVLENTFVFRAGDEYCDENENPDCQYYLYVELEDGTDLYYGVYDNDTGLNIQAHYDQVGVFGEDLSWQFVGVQNSAVNSNYSYGTYIHPNDPDFLQANLNNEQEGPDDLNNEQEGPDDLNNEQEGGYEPVGLDCGGPDQPKCIQNPLGDGSDLPSFIESLVEIIMKAGIPLVVLGLVYAGLRFVLAQGNPDKLAEARKILLLVVIGSLVLLSAWTIVNLLNNTFNAILSSISSIIV